MAEHEKGGFLIRSWRHLERPVQILVYLLIALSAVMLFHQSEYLVIHLFNVFLLFVFAAIIALLLTPVIDRMEQVALFKGRRVFAVLLLYVVIIGVVAGLRALTAPAVVSWAAFLGWVDLDNRWLHWLGHPATVTVLTILAVVELVTDQLPKTPSRKTPPQFITRIITGGFAGAVLGAAYHYTWSSLGAGVVGAVLGTLGGYELRSRLVAATGGRDLPVALLEDVIAVGGGFLIVYFFGSP